MLYRPAYCTREEVARALNIGLVGSDFSKIDRAVQSAADSLDRLCKRKFYYTTATYSIDWPNYQYAYPWRLWLNQYELAGQPSLVVSGPYLPTPLVIPSSNYILQPINDGPPYTNIELRRDQNSAFGNNTTPQNDIQITGPFGYWMLTQSAGTVTASVAPSDVVLQVSSGASPGVGDVVNLDIERMIVTDSTFTSTGVPFLTGITSAQSNDNIGTVTNGVNFSVDEQIMVDFEIMLITQIFGNTIIVKRAFGGSILNTHSAGNIWARRQVSVLRGQLGTAAAVHSQNAPITIAQIPGLVKQLAIAEAVTWPNLEAGGYSGAASGFGMGAGAGISQGQTGSGEAKEPAYGAALPDLRMQVLEQYGRQSRSAVI